MATDDVTSASGIEMNDADIDELLEAIGHGTLSLTNGEEVYGVPVSFGYDGERIFVSLVRFGDDSKKLQFVDESPSACLTVYHADSRFDWRSVIVTGPLQDVPEPELDYVKDVLDDNAWFPTIYPPTSPMTGVRRMELHVEEATGRKSEEYQ
ncbi:MAG: pyridoxamine 5'-phosphate oxidase family protein [Halobacteriota archaeon]